MGAQPSHRGALDKEEQRGAGDEPRDQRIEAIGGGQEEEEGANQPTGQRGDRKAHRPCARAAQLAEIPEHAPDCPGPKRHGARGVRGEGGDPEPDERRKGEERPTSSDRIDGAPSRGGDEDQGQSRQFRRRRDDEMLRGYESRGSARRGRRERTPSGSMFGGCAWRTRRMRTARASAMLSRASGD